MNKKFTTTRSAKRPKIQYQSASFIEGSEIGLHYGFVWFVDLRLQLKILNLFLCSVSTRVGTSFLHEGKKWGKMNPSIPQGIHFPPVFPCINCAFPECFPRKLVGTSIFHGKGKGSDFLFLILIFLLVCLVV